MLIFLYNFNLLLSIWGWRMWWMKINWKRLGKWIGYTMLVFFSVVVLMIGVLMYLIKDIDRSREPNPEEFYWNALIDMQHVAAKVNGVELETFAAQSIKKLKKFRKEGMSEPGVWGDFDTTLSIAYIRLMGDYEDDCYSIISREELVGAYWGRALLWGSEDPDIAGFRDRINYKNQDVRNRKSMLKFFSEQEFDVLEKKACLYHALYLHGPKGKNLWKQKDMDKGTLPDAALNPRDGL